LPTALEVKFAEFPVALIETHGKDLTVSTGPSRSETPAPHTGTSTPAVISSSTPPVQPAKQVAEKLKALNTARVSVEASFMAAADDLFGLLTDEKRIPSWSRAPAQVRFSCF
jgi:activator of HSP90 ATPase